MPTITAGFEEPKYFEQIDEETFDKIKKSKEALLTLTLFEESIAQVRDSLRELELFVLENALDDYSEPSVDYEFFQKTRMTGNRRLSTFLNSVTALRDQVPKIVTDNGNAGEDFIKDWNALKNENISFAFLERLRNFAQHQRQPIKTATLGGQWDKTLTLCEHHSSLFVPVANVCKNRRIATSERTRYETYFGESADALYVCKETMSCVGSLAKKYREQTENFYQENKETYERKIRCVINSGEKSHYITVSNDNESEKFTIFKALSDRLGNLRKTLLFENYERHYITSRARRHSKSAKIEITANEVPNRNP